MGLVWIISSKNWGPLWKQSTPKKDSICCWHPFWQLAWRLPLRDLKKMSWFFPHIACFVCFLNQRWLYLGELLFHSPRKMICVDMHFFVFIYKSRLWPCGSEKIVDHIRSQHVFTYFLWTYCPPCCGPLPCPKLAASNWRWWFLFGIQEDYCWNPVCHFTLVCQCIPFCTWFQFIANFLWGFNSSQLVISKLITATPTFFWKSHSGAAEVEQWMSSTQLPYRASALTHRRNYYVQCEGWNRGRCH